MSIDDGKVRDAIQELSGAKNNPKFHILEGEVTEVNESQGTCSALILTGKIDGVLEDIRLMAAMDDGFLLIPKIGSNIFVSYKEKTPPFVSQFSAIEKVVIVAGRKQASVRIDGDMIELEYDQSKITLKDKIVFNDGSNGGLTKIDTLIQKLNNLENQVNNLATAYSSHSHVLALSTGTGTASTPTSAPPSPLTPTQKSELENTKVVH